MILNLENKKLRYWKIMSKTRTPLNKAKYKSCVKSIKDAHSHVALEREGNILRSGNSGIVYKHINSRITHKSEVAPLQEDVGNSIYKDDEYAVLLNSHFVGVGQIDNGLLPVIDPLAGFSDSLSDVNFDENVIIKQINKSLKKLLSWFRWYSSYFTF